MRLYVDANVIIYAIEGQPRFGAVARAWLVAASETGTTFVTSLFTEFECLVAPYRRGDFGLADSYTAFLRQPSWELVPVSFRMLRRAALIRAQHGLKSPDAVQAASCIGAGCDLFLTNDVARFQRLSEMRVARVEDPPAL